MMTRAIRAVTAGLALLLTAASAGTSFGSTQDPTHESVAKQPPPAQPPTHTVREGDNLWNLARRYGTSVAELQELNRLKNAALRIGQQLLLPCAPEVQPPFRPRFLQQASVGEAAVQEPLATPEALVTPETSATAATAVALSLRERLVSSGYGFIGVRYRWNGTSEKRGFDCSGLVKRLFSMFSIEVPRSSREQFKVGEKVARAALEIGDLVFFSRGGKVPNHVGIYIGGDFFLHAASRGRQVMISSLREPWYSRRFIGARRILDLWKDSLHTAEGGGN